jgi:hypothetical protein
VQLLAHKSVRLLFFLAGCDVNDRSRNAELKRAKRRRRRRRRRI